MGKKGKGVGGQVKAGMVGVPLLGSPRLVISAGASPVMGKLQTAVVIGDGSRLFQRRQMPPPRWGCHGSVLGVATGGDLGPDMTFAPRCGHGFDGSSMASGGLDFPAEGCIGDDGKGNSVVVGFDPRLGMGCFTDNDIFPLGSSCGPLREELAHVGLKREDCELGYREKIGDTNKVCELGDGPHGFGSLDGHGSTLRGDRVGPRTSFVDVVRVKGEVVGGLRLIPGVRTDLGHVRVPEAMVEKGA
ncbi:hypothetical protein Dimus_001058 [Dionaea muscipula]